MEVVAVGVGWVAWSGVVALIGPWGGFVVGAFAVVEASAAVERIVAGVAFAGLAFAGLVCVEVRTSAVGEAFVAVEPCAVVEASAGASVAASAPLARIDHAVHSHHSIPGIPTLPASIVSPILPRPYAEMSLHTWKDSPHPPGSGRPGYPAPCPPTFRTRPATWRGRLDGRRRSSLRTPTSARIADPTSGASWTPARRLWMSFLGYCAETLRGRRLF